ncbi:MAG: ABC transporter permease, partial [Limisphaerales bacterium]
LKAGYLQEVRATRGVATAAPVLMTAFTDDTGAQVVYVGADKNILALKPGWRITGGFPETRAGLLVGSAVAQREHWQLGQSVPLRGLNGERGIVRGVLAATHGADDEFVFLRLGDAQQLFNHERELTHILVRLSDPNQLDEVVTQLRACDAGLDMNVVPLAHLFRTIRTLVNSTRLLLGCVALVALLVAGAGVSNAILMAVSERTREIGVMRALGASHADIFRLFWLETVQVCLVGAAVGVVGAFGASRAVETWLRERLPFAPTDALIRWEWWGVGVCVAGALVLGSVAGLLPAWRAARLAPMEAMRSPEGCA